MKLNLNKLLNWHITNISRPIPSYIVENGHEKLCGYIVTITFAHHGSTSKFFDAESENLWTMYRGGPHAAAKEYYKQMQRRIMRNKMREKAL